MQLTKREVWGRSFAAENQCRLFDRLLWWSPRVVGLVGSARIKNKTKWDGLKLKHICIFIVLVIKFS